jgi:hypothetical protein
MATFIPKVPQDFIEQAFSSWYTTNLGSTPTMLYKDYLSTISTPEELSSTSAAIEAEAKRLSETYNRELSSLRSQSDTVAEQYRLQSLIDKRDTLARARTARKIKPFVDLAGKAVSTTAKGIGGLMSVGAKGVSNLGKNAFKRGTQTVAAGQKSQSLFLAPQFKPIPSNLHERTSVDSPAGAAIVPTMKNIPSAKLLAQGSTRAGNAMVARSSAGDLVVSSLKNSPAGQAMMPGTTPSVGIDTSGLTRGGPLPGMSTGKLSVPSFRKPTMPMPINTKSYSMDTEVPLKSKSVKVKKPRKVKKNSYNSQMSAVRRSF